MAYKLGGNAKIYYGGTVRAAWPSAGAAAGLNVINRVGDLKLNMDKGEDDSTTRDTPGWEMAFPAFIKASIDFQLKYDPADASYQALEANFFNTNGATVSIAALDGPSNGVGNKGLWGDFSVFKFEKGENVKNMQTVDVTLKPALNTAAGTNVLPPSWVTVA